MSCEIVQVDGLTEGAACTTLLAKELIDNNEPLIMANSDQFLEWDSNEFMYSMIADDIDGGIVSFEATHPKWSFAKLGKNGFVSEVAEKMGIDVNIKILLSEKSKSGDSKGLDAAQEVFEVEDLN